MANLLTLKRRIRVATNVSKTTRAIQMIAASKLKKAQDSTLSSRPYVEKLHDVSFNLTSRLNEDEIHEYMKEKEINKNLMVVISPDKGLCGSLITNLFKELLSNDTKNTVFIAVGKKMELNLSKIGKEIIASFPFGTSLPSFDIVYPIAKIIDEYFLGGKISRVTILSAKFESIFSQKPVIETLLPIRLSGEEKKEEILFEPDRISILSTVLRHFLEMTLYQNLLETYASEQAAKMIAMKNATDNAKEIIEQLRLEYNKGRQEKITNEILDIGGATFALKYED